MITSLVHAPLSNRRIFVPGASATIGIILRAICSAAAAHAGDAINDSAKPEQQRAWTVTIGGGTEYGPNYEGATNQNFSFVPYIDITRFGEAPEPSPPDDNFDFPLIDWHGLEVGPVGGYNTGRS